ncbi:MAG: CHAT domain-containing protein [Aquamicrobium sp.]|uniref:CHAT domain-containing tetratricopeptide repeat protein n=1 Tax=Aquamicrobium sp. TaxID=1872579 RepID=UPI00349EF4B7|nr:CHAT domain-containing protein [Aquamicrobium sp.]
MRLSLLRTGLVLSTALALPLLLSSPGAAQPADSAAAVAEMEALFQQGDAARIDAELFPRMQEMLALLDPADPAKGDLLVERLMDVKGMLGDGAAQDELAALYEKRARDAHGENSEPHLKARIRSAFSLMQAGRGEEGYPRLREALLASARTDHHVFTIRQYMEAANLFHANGMNDQAGELFADGAQTQAAQADIKELADFYLAYAQLRTAVIDPQQHFVPLYTTATHLYARHYGNESRELIHANDKLATAMGDIGQYGTAVSLMQGNYDLALDVLGPDDTITWRLANNLADVLRGLGAPSRALEYDRVVLENRIRHYGQNHFNTLVSANNNGQNYLDLGDWDNARKLFTLCRDIVVATGDETNLPVMEAWLDYTDLVSGAKPMDEAAVARMDALITDADYPAILSLKAANLLADHFAKVGDGERRMKHIEQAYNIAGSEMTTTHPLTFAGRIAIANAKAETDTKAAAAEFAAIDSEMLAWVYLQVFYAGNRDVADTTRAMADDMLYHYGRLAELDASVVPAFADASRRWPSLSTVDADNLLKIERLIDADDTESADLLRQVSRQSRIARELFASGGEQDLAFTFVEALREFEGRLNSHVVERYELTPDKLSAPLPAPADLLAPGEVLVQYFITRQWRSDRETADPLADTRLYAIVSRAGAAPVLRHLGDPRQIVAGGTTTQMASLRSTRSSGERGAVPLTIARSTFSDLHERLIAPLAADLEGAGTVFVIPDGQLFAVPFSMLSDAEGRLLEERFEMRFLTRPEALYRPSSGQTLAEGGRAVLAGGINYSRGDERGADPLPGTLREVEAIAGILKSDRLSIDTLTAGEVSEAALRERMEGATIAHLATHGAYRSARAGGASDVDTLWQSEVILSGSGDRHAMARDEADGRLYAFELMSWDLRALELLVLSACETGRGEETFVGGLRGLPTAIDIAGARRSLLTLWPVADDGTAEFMVRYYEYLTEGRTWSEALRQTRREAIGGELPAANSPLVWGAFVLFEN